MSDAIQPPVAEDGKVAEARNFLLDTRDELAKVSWPPKDELVKATKGVLIGSAMLGVALGILDWVLGKILVDGVAALAR